MNGQLSSPGFQPPKGSIEAVAKIEITPESDVNAIRFGFLCAAFEALDSFTGGEVLFSY